MTVPVCKVCEHPRLAEIDADARAGVSGDAIVRRFGGFSKSGVLRHKRNGHVAPDPSGRRAGVPVTDPNEVLRRVMDELAAMDTSKMAPAARIAHLDAMRRVSSDLAKLAPPPVPDVVTADEVEGLAELMELVVEAMEPYPLARMRLLERVRETGLEKVLG